MDDRQLDLFNPYLEEPAPASPVLELLEKESGFIEGIVHGLDPDAAGRAVGLRPAAALARPRVKEALLQALVRAGLTEDLIARKMAKGLRATRPVVSKGEVVAEIADQVTRHKYLTTLLEVRGDLQRDTAGRGDLGWEEVLVAVRARRSAGP